MPTNRLEAFSDAVIAILITIMVLELKVPSGQDPDSLEPLIPLVLSYLLSFVYLGIYWNNHHHLLATAERVTGALLWSNLHLLFWLSLFPVATAWMGTTGGARWPTAIYGGVMLGAALAFQLVSLTIKRDQGVGGTLAKAVGTDVKGRISPALYAAAIPLAFVAPVLSFALYVGVAVLWIVPDRRLAEAVEEES